MFCPRCGQQQAANEVRFCSACGLPLNVVSDVVAGGGVVPQRLVETAAGGGKLSPRQKGLRQGAMLMLSTLLVMPIVIFLGVAMLRLPGELIPLVGAFCVMGGLLRMLYAAFFEENTPQGGEQSALPGYVPPAVHPSLFNPPAQTPALPPRQPGAPVPQHRPRRANTGELVERPPSVTENTTRLLKDKPEEPPAN